MQTNRAIHVGYPIPKPHLTSTHAQAEEWLYFHSGTGRATVFTGDANARTFDFSAGDTAAFPAGSGHYVENTSADSGLTYLEVFRSGKTQDISLAQWLALTPPEMAAQALNVDWGAASCW